jgi:hypothetical protein
VKGSLRTRLIVGAVVWMTAVLLAVSALLLKIMRNHPDLELRGVTFFTTIGFVAGAFLVGDCSSFAKRLRRFGVFAPVSLRCARDAARESKVTIRSKWSRW